MELKNINFGEISRIEICYLLVHLICLFLQFNILANVLMFVLFVHSIKALFSNNIGPCFLLLILGSYQSAFINIYTFEIGGLNLAYVLLLFIFIYLFRNLKPKRKYHEDKLKILKNHKYILLPLLVMFAYALVAGIFFSYSIGWYLNELAMFSIFFLLIIAIAGLKEYDSSYLLKLIFNYVIYFYPIITIFSILISEIDFNPYFDEFEKFYYVAIIPCMFVKFPKKVLVISLSIIAFVLKAKYTYTSSLNVLLLLSSGSILFIFSKIRFRSKLLAIIILSASSFIIYDNSSVVTKFKINQAFNSVGEVLGGNITAIPKSPRVRVVEFMLSFKNLEDSGIPFVFLGKGFGSYIDDSIDNWFNKYNIQLNPIDDYSLDEIIKKQYKKGHGTLSYIPIKLGVFGIIYIIFLSILMFSLIRWESITWFAISAPLYILTTFSFGLKSYIYSGVFIGLTLVLMEYDRKKRRITSN